MPTPATLLDIPGFEGLGRACRRFQVQFTAFGGVIRRYVAWRVAPTKAEIDLFDLTPFQSDIDLVHTGGSELTPHILRFLHADLPFAECFRWELRSVEENALFRQATPFNGILPANLMSLATNAGEGIVDPWNGRRDIEERSYRYIRNGFYSDSPLFREGRDLEFFSVLLYFRILLEAGISRSELAAQPGWADALAVIGDARGRAAIIALQESAYLRARLRYLLKSMTVAARSRPLGNALRNRSGLRALLEEIDACCALRNGYGEGSIARFLDETDLSPRRVLVASGRIGGDQFRLPHHTGAWAAGEAAARELDRLLEQPSLEPRREGEARTRRLGAGQEALLASPPLPLHPGISPSSRLNETAAEEFVHFAVPALGEHAAALRRHGEENLAAVLALTATGGERAYTTFFPLTAVCALKDREEAPGDGGVLLTIRMNCGAIPEIAHDLFARWQEAREPVARIFVLGWTQAP